MTNQKIEVYVSLKKHKVKMGQVFQTVYNNRDY